MAVKAHTAQLGHTRKNADLKGLGLVAGWQDRPTFGQLKTLWNSLSGGAMCTPFQTPEFVHAFFEKVAATKCERHAVLSLCDEVTREPILLLPLIWSQKGPFRIVSSPDMGLADQNGPVIGKRFDEFFGGREQALIPCLLQSIPQCDVFKMCKLHSTIGGKSNPFYETEESIHQGYSLFLDQQALQEVVTVSKKSVYKEARTKFRKLQREGVELVEAESPRKREDICRVLLEQRKHRIEIQSGLGSMDVDTQENFYRYLSRLTDENSPVTALALKKDEEIVSAVVMLSDGTSANGVLVSIGDPKWYRMSPGMVLFVKSLEWAAETGIQNFSLGAGLHAYKNRFGAAMQETKRLLVPMNMRGRTYVTALRAKQLSKTIYDMAVSSDQV